MKRKDIIKGIILTMQKELPFPVLERELQLPVGSGQIITVAGVRRCGKSSLMKIVANKLIQSGENPHSILWVNFDDERLDGMKTDELDEVVQAYRELYPEIPFPSVNIFFDEIQNVEKWELFVLRLYKTYNKNIYISGSNAKMLSSQLATALRGWPIEYEAFPLSFKEYLRFKDIEASEYDEEGCALLRRYCHEYLHSSTFPEIVLMKEESLKIRKLQGYFNTMLFRDLIEHYSLSNQETVRYFLKRLMLNLTKPTSVNAIFNDLKSQGRKLDKNRLYDLADMACEIFMFLRVNKWSPSMITEASSQPKYYFIDNGMRNSVVMPYSDDDGKLLENIVFLHLRRYLDPSMKITYFNEKVECDFVVQHDEKIEQLIQVCWDTSSPDTRERELRGIYAAHIATNCKTCLIITFEEEDEVIYNDLTVKIVPAWKWLLHPDPLHSLP
ncbi:MAG: ATP-binding protein [Muribaculaceae bacterium]|nr:ATP-binding protein [Muribaculaceae bacterium]